MKAGRKSRRFGNRSAEYTAMPRMADEGSIVEIRFYRSPQDPIGFYRARVSTRKGDKVYQYESVLDNDAPLSVADWLAVAVMHMYHQSVDIP